MREDDIERFGVEREAERAIVRLRSIEKMIEEHDLSGQAVADLVHETREDLERSIEVEGNQDAGYDADRLVVVSCSACENRYLKENATVPSETIVDGEVVNPDDDLDRCPFCGQTTKSSVRLGVKLDRSVDTGAGRDD